MEKFDWRIFFGWRCAIPVFLALSMMASAHAASPVVLELFTSQGCSSCPPADALLQQLSANNPAVLALSLHVDYWDRLGWRDPFSLGEATERQMLYVHALKQTSLYTPELVIDGARGIIGSREREIKAAIETAVAQPKPIDVSLTPDAGNKHLSIAFAGTVPANVTGGIWLMTYNPHAVTAIRGGENSGREMTSINNVKSITRLAALSDPLPQKLQADISPDPSDGYAVLVQATSGAIIGAGSYLPPPKE